MAFPANPEPRLRVETLAPPLIVVMTFAILQPLIVIATTIFPPQFGEVQWRVRAFALFLGTTPQVAVSLVVIAAVGLFSEHYRAVRWASIAGIVLAVVLVPMLLFDALDVMQVRTIVPADQLRGFVINTTQTGVMAGVLVPLLLWLGRRGLQAGKKVHVMGIDDHLVVGSEQPATAPFDPRVNN